MPPLSQLQRVPPVHREWPDRRGILTPPGRSRPTQVGGTPDDALPTASVGPRGSSASRPRTA